MSCFSMLHDLEILILDLRPLSLGDSPLHCNVSVLGRQQLRLLLGLQLLESSFHGGWTVEREVLDSWQQSRRQMGLRPLRQIWPVARQVGGPNRE
jgi:hypothetical protein